MADATFLKKRVAFGKGLNEKLICWNHHKAIISEGKAY